MTVLIVLACILLALWLLCQLRIGATVDYSETGLVLSIKAGPFTIGILPAKEKPQKEKPRKQKPLGTEHIIIDGYNFIFANDEMRKLAEGDVSLARDALIRVMCDYASIKRCKVIIVFDAYKRRGGEGSREEYGPVSVVYTREAETADAFIEKTTHDLAEKCKVRVVSSDMQEQLVVLGAGGLRVSAREFANELLLTEKEIKEIIESLK